jgi:hypothetical protein
MMLSSEIVRKERSEEMRRDEISAKKYRTFLGA